MKIKDDNIATYGNKIWEQTGTIAIDFATYLDKLSSIDNIGLKDWLSKGWYQVGFVFDKSFINNSDTLNFKIVLARKQDIGKTKFGYVLRGIKKADFLNYIVGFTVYVSNQVHFEKDDINWQQLENIEG